MSRHRPSRRVSSIRNAPAKSAPLPEPAPSALPRQEGTTDDPAYVPVTLHLTQAAHGLLVAQTAYEEYNSLEACIVHQLAVSATAWCEQTLRKEELEELFLAGQVIVKKEDR